jgi:hypothetical protein
MTFYVVSIPCIMGVFAEQKYIVYHILVDFKFFNLETNFLWIDQTLCWYDLLE